MLNQPTMHSNIQQLPRHCHLSSGLWVCDLEKSLTDLERLRTEIVLEFARLGDY
jgi:hypothetical protein